MTSAQIPKGTEELAGKRRLIRALVAPTDPADAMTAYYALEHPAARVQLTLHRTPSGRVDGFVAVCQTGRELFVPLVVMRGPHAALVELLQHALLPGRQYLVVVPLYLRGAVEDALDVVSGQINVIHTLVPGMFRPVLNVMVQPGQTRYRYEIWVQAHVVAAAGVNWRTDAVADVYAYTAGDYQGRGWGRAVGAACVQDLLSDGLLPLYTAGEANAASRALAEALGFRDSGAREFECRASMRVEKNRSAP
ncbi:MAG: GNAT family N-acetyltransferase [Anaerolineae bacterium]|nr:GNAT family N-acetyltransferase [Anaerolineae bacterium]